MASKPMYHVALPHVMSTIYMPTHRSGLGEAVPIHDKRIDLPFPIVRFIEPFDYDPAETERGHLRTSEVRVSNERVRGVEEMIVWEQDDGLASCTRITWQFDDGRALTLYAPEEPTLNDAQFLITLWRFNEWLADRSARYVERPVSRQVRRASGFAPDYREYVILRKGEVRQSDWGAARSMRKMLPALHAVRGHDRQEHLRQLPSGEVIVVKGSRISPHVRGKGDALQVKDYRADRLGLA